MLTKKENEINILGLCTISASSYHRIIIPLNAIHGTITIIDGAEYKYNCTIKNTPNEGKFFTEEDVKSYDVLAYNWVIAQDANTLAVWCLKYNTKLWMDCDDSWRLPANHVNRTTKGIKEFYPYLESTIINQISTSDIVTTSNDLLLADVAPYSSFCGSVFNYLPVGQDQFIPKKDVEKDTINLAIMCSVSHLNDLFSISRIWDRISADVEIKNKCKLQIIGADKNDAHWKKIIDMFSINNFNIEVIEYALPDKYMELMDSVDVMLAPLEDNEFNDKKSGLRLIECAIKNVPVISDFAYSKKQDFNAYIMCKKKNDWYKSIKKLIQKNEDGEYEFQRIGKILSEQNLKNNNFEERINKIKAGIEYILTHEYKLDENLKVFGITYNSETQYTEYTQYKNDHIRSTAQKSWRMEWNPILDIIDSDEFTKEDYIGIFSFKFNQKTGYSSKLVDKVFRQHKNQGYDLFNLSKRYWNSGKEFMEFSESQHKGLINILKLCLNNLRVEYKENPSTIIYSNFFLLKSELFKEFIESWIKPSLKYMEEEIWELANQDADYKSGLEPSKLEEYTGMTYYNFVCFVCERMISQWIDYKELKVKNIG